MTTWRDDVAAVGRLDHPVAAALRKVGQPADVQRMIPTHKISLAEWVIGSVIPPALTAFVEAELAEGRLLEPEVVAGQDERLADALAEVESLTGVAGDLEMLLAAAEAVSGDEHIVATSDSSRRMARLREVVARLRAEPRR